METIQQKRERRNALVKDTRNLMDQNPGASWKEDHQKKYDDNMGEVERIDADISRQQRILDMEAEKAFTAPAAEGGKRGEEQSPVRALFAKWARRGDKALSDEDWTAVRAAMSGNPDANPEQGGFTVPKETAATVIEALKSFGGMRQVATVLPTSSGNPISYPTTNGTAEEGEIVPENQEASDEDISFGTKTLGAHKFSSKVITVPFELLQDSAINVEALVLGRINSRLARIGNRMYTVGSGQGQPMGVVTASMLGKAGLAAAAPNFTYDDLIDLEHSVDPAYRDAATFMFHDQALALVRKVKDTTGRPIYVPALADGSVGGSPARLNNRNIVINQHMDAPAPGAKSVLFGDFSKYVIRDVMSVTLFRFTDSAYTKKGQVGFLAWMRADGNLMDIGGAVKHFRHGAAA